MPRCTPSAKPVRPTGGIAAAATTSLPEKLGGSRNWDYRYCGLRDATFVLYALSIAGYQDEAVAFRNWLVRAVAGKASQLQTVYGLAGERRLAEYEIDALPGYEDSRPVRVGNDAHHQCQLDIYGEMMDALHFSRRSSSARPAAWELHPQMETCALTSPASGETGGAGHGFTRDLDRPGRRPPGRGRVSPSP